LISYPDPKTKGKPYTVGWGSTRKKDGTSFKLGEKITQQEADELFDYQIQNEFLPMLRKIPYWNEMNENQQGALLSFAYNLGADFYGSPYFNTITKVLKNKEWDKVPTVLELYRDPGTDVEEGLLRRRKVEGKLWRKS
jgi:lysozyme